MSSNGRRRLLATVAVALATAFVGGCGDDDAEAGRVIELSTGTVPLDGIAADRPASDGGDDLPFVAIVGDSITVGANGGLEEAAEKLQIEVVVDAEVGRRVANGSNPLNGVEAAKRVIDEYGQPDLWVIALGTNDVGHFDTYDELISEVLAAIGPDRPVAWIDVWVDGYQGHSGRFNEALHAALVEYGAATIGPWSSVATDEGVLSDGVHPTDDGEELFVEIVTAQIELWLG